MTGFVSPGSRFMLNFADPNFKIIIKMNVINYIGVIDFVGFDNNYCY